MKTAIVRISRHLKFYISGSSEYMKQQIAEKLMVSSTKSMTGHLLGAAGAVEAIFTALALKEGFVPATIGYQVPDPACNLDIVPNEGRTADLKIALSNSLGFGGHNAAIVLKRYRSFP